MLKSPPRPDVSPCNVESREDVLSADLSFRRPFLFAKTTLHSRSHLRFLPFLLLAKMALVAALLLLLGFIGSNLDNIAAMVTMTKMEMMEDTTESGREKD